jgi:3',5'-cyclic-nucleotide phosphodiesterase
MEAKKFKLLSILIIGLLSVSVFAKPISPYHFRVIPLGTMGGELDENLSAYLVAPRSGHDWVSLDAGTMCSQLEKLNFQDKIHAYLLSHAHLDHITGLVICSVGDGGDKKIIGLNSTINYLRDYIFNWKIWPNFTNEGKMPQLNKYKLQRLIPNKTVSISKTNLQVQAFVLKHGNGYSSTAFLLRSDDHYLLYFGDTGPDSVENSQCIQTIWKKITPIIKKHKLSAIFIESSYLSQQPDNKLFGHLNPKWLSAELQELAEMINRKAPQTALRGLKIVVTHVKQERSEKNMPAKILQELNEKNHLGVQFIFPKQGYLLTL